jgi:hypothetical protein
LELLLPAAVLASADPIIPSFARERRMTKKTTPRASAQETAGAPDELGLSGPEDDPGTGVVGITASTDAQDTLLGLLRALPAASGLSYVVLQHGADGTATLSRALRGKTALKVQSVTRRTRLQPDTIYLASPERGVRALDGALVPGDAQAAPAQVADQLLRSLAEAHGPRSAAVVLCGPGADGADGVARIKAHGGLTMAQAPEEAGAEGMPHSAIATGMVDWVLPLAEMPQRLLSHFSPQVAEADAPAAPEAGEAQEPVQQELLPVEEPVVESPVVEPPPAEPVQQAPVQLREEEPAAYAVAPPSQPQPDAQPATADLQALADAAGIAAVFLDRELRITRYTPAAPGLFRLIPADLGRPLTDLSTTLDYPELAADARGVLAGQPPVEREVCAAGGGCFIARMRPCHAGEDGIAGVVLCFTDVGALKSAHEALQKVREGARDALHSLSQALGEIEHAANRLLAEKLAASQRELAQTIQQRTAALRRGAQELLPRAGDGNDNR